MKINKNKLRRAIRESINNNSGAVMQSGADKIKMQLKSFDRRFIIQTYELCESLPGLDFQQIVREMIIEMLDGLNNGALYDRVYTTVSSFIEILHGDKLDTFYIESENEENDVQMEFVFKTVTDVMENLTDYYVNYFVAIGQGK
tara:strand:- start:61 stop:492 length:432 start_codon:yes stop_codon:yes gene_type:complete